jgi:hypothetical protein
LLTLSAMISHSFTPTGFCLFCSLQGNEKNVRADVPRTKLAIEIREVSFGGVASTSAVPQQTKPQSKIKNAIGVKARHSFEAPVWRN